jgi:hypothetical protein
MGVAVASMALGAILGFLFGIPRSLQGDASSTTDPDAPGYRANTNLEQISDWLTKILVGVGLIQIGSAGEWAGRLVNSVAESLGSTPTARVVAAATLILYIIGGFLSSYLLTRTRVTRQLFASDLDLVTARAVHQATIQVQQTVDRRERVDVLALSLVDHVLNPSPGTLPPKQEDLNEALIEASDTICIQTFIRAHQVRQTTWRNDKERMARTIPIFEALIAADTLNKYHRNHAQLGYALKDLPNPKWREAEEALSEAITRRGSSPEGWLFYEFNRAICRIHLDPVRSGFSAPERREAILEDIRATGPLMAKLTQVPEVSDWLKRNSIAQAELHPVAGQP